MLAHQTRVVSMNVRRRNQIVILLSAVVTIGAMLFFAWAGWATDRRRSIWPFILLALGMVVFVGCTVIGMWRDRIELDALERDAGLDPDAIPDDPVPLLPPRSDRAGLLLGIVFLLVVAALALANYLGWVEGFSRPERRR